MMFQIPIDKIFVIYLTVTTAIFIFFWLVSKINRYRFRYKTKKENLFRCPICLFVYIDAGEKNIIKCPRCNSYNDIKEAKM